jgi:hypothetical protein
MKARSNLTTLDSTKIECIYALRFLSNGDPEFPVGIFVPRFATLRFILEAGSPLCVKSPQLFTNCPEQGRFSREDFHEVQRLLVPVNHF